MDPSQRRAAAEWFARLQSRSVTTAELNDFARWRRDSDNEAAYRALEAVWEGACGLSSDPDIAAAVDRATSPLGGKRHWFGNQVRWLFAGAAALAAVLAVVITRPASQPSWSTGVGEKAFVQLEDGTRVQLDAGTTMAADLHVDKRLVRLDRGQAFFDVAHDRHRPFVVEADGVQITALGTRFDVDTHGRTIRVSLLTGSVEVKVRDRVQAVRLRPGESVLVSAGVIGRSISGVASDMTSWRQGRLTFRDTPLPEAIAAMNRYTERPMAVRGGARVTETISGDFAADDVEGFVKAVDALFGPETVTREPER